MSSKFFVSEGTGNQRNITSNEIPELEDQWILIKDKLSTKDMSDLQSKLYTIEAPQMTRGERRRKRKAGEETTRMTMNSQVPIYLGLAIIDWSFVDGVGVKIPVTHENIDHLLPEISAQLYDLIDENNPL